MKTNILDDYNIEHANIMLFYKILSKFITNPSLLNTGKLDVIIFVYLFTSPHATTSFGNSPLIIIKYKFLVLSDAS